MIQLSKLISLITMYELVCLGIKYLLPPTTLRQIPLHLITPSDKFRLFISSDKVRLQVNPRKRKSCLSLIKGVMIGMFSPDVFASPSFVRTEVTKFQGVLQYKKNVNQLKDRVSRVVFQMSDDSFHFLSASKYCVLSKKDSFYLK